MNQQGRRRRLIREMNPGQLRQVLRVLAVDHQQAVDDAIAVVAERPATPVEGQLSMLD